MKNLKCFECGTNDATENLNGRCEKCHNFNEEVKADKEYWRRRKEEIRSEASLKYTGFN